MKNTNKSSIRERVKRLSPEKQEELKQYVESVKEIKRKINEILSEGGGNMSSGLNLSPVE